MRYIHDVIFARCWKSPLVKKCTNGWFNILKRKLIDYKGTPLNWKVKNINVRFTLIFLIKKNSETNGV